MKWMNKLVIGSLVIGGLCWANVSDAATLRNKPASKTKSEAMWDAFDDTVNGDGTTNNTGVNTHTGNETHTGAESHTGAETHTGSEIHTGNEIHSGAESHTGFETGIIMTKSVNFSEIAGGVTTLTATVPIPAGAYLLDVQFMVSVVAGGTSASLVIGDDFDADGWLTATDLKATDLVVGEVFSLLNTGGGATPSSTAWLGNNGAYLVSATGRKGNVQTGNAGVYYATSDNVIAIVTQGTPGTTGRYHMVVYYTIPTLIVTVDA